MYYNKLYSHRSDHCFSDESGKSLRSGYGTSYEPVGIKYIDLRSIYSTNFPVVQITFLDLIRTMSVLIHLQPMFYLCRNQLIGLPCKSTNCFLYEWNIGLNPLMVNVPTLCPAKTLEVFWYFKEV